MGAGHRRVGTGGLGAQHQVSVRLPQSDRSDSHSLAGLQYNTALPGFSTRGDDLQPPDSRGCRNRHWRGTSLDAIDTHMRSLRRGQHLERSPRRLECGFQVLTLTGPLYGDVGNVVEVSGSTDQNGALAGRNAQHARSATDLNAIDTDDRGNPTRINIQLSWQLL